MKKNKSLVPVSSRPTAVAVPAQAVLPVDSVSKGVQVPHVRRYPGGKVVLINKGVRIVNRFHKTTGQVVRPAVRDSVKPAIKVHWTDVLKVDRGAISKPKENEAVALPPNAIYAQQVNNFHHDFMATMGQITYTTSDGKQHICHIETRSGAGPMIEFICEKIEKKEPMIIGMAEWSGDVAEWVGNPKDSEPSKLSPIDDPSQTFIDEYNPEGKETVLLNIPDMTKQPSHIMDIMLSKVKKLGTELKGDRIDDSWLKIMGDKKQIAAIKMIMKNKGVRFK